jgi:hypothetical protein
MRLKQNRTPACWCACTYWTQLGRRIQFGIVAQVGRVETKHIAVDDANHDLGHTHCRQEAHTECQDTAYDESQKANVQGHHSAKVAVDHGNGQGDVCPCRQMGPIDGQWSNKDEHQVEV